MLSYGALHPSPYDRRQVYELQSYGCLTFPVGVMPKNQLFLKLLKPSLGSPFIWFLMLQPHRSIAQIFFNFSLLILSIQKFQKQIYVISNSAASALVTLICTLFQKQCDFISFSRISPFPEASLKATSKQTCKASCKTKEMLVATKTSSTTVNINVLLYNVCVFSVSYSALLAKATPA